MTDAHRTYPTGTVIPYFEDIGKTREVAYWTTATQVQLERWEPLVAESILLEWKKQTAGGALVWQIDMERHFVLISATHLITAMKFAMYPVPIDEILTVEIPAGRDLLEHWKENIPVFNMHPRSAQPKYPSGKAFAALNPRQGPYDGGAWDNQVGPKLLPNVPATALRGLVEQVKTQLVKDRPSYRKFFHDWAQSPWHGGDDPSDRWYPHWRE